MVLVAAILLLVALAFVAVHIRGIYEAANTAKLRTPQMGFSERINWAAVVDDGIVACKSGALMASWRYIGEDHGSASVEDMNAMSRFINQAVKGLGSGFMLHIDAVRQATPGYPEPERNSFPDPICRAIDEERRRLFTRLGTIYQSQFFLTLTWLPPGLKTEKTVKFLVEEPESDAEKRTARETTLDVIATFKSKIAEFESNLVVAVKLERLKGVEAADDESGATAVFDRQLEYLNFCLTGVSRPVRLPPVPMYIDQIIAAEAHSGFVPVIDDKYVRCINIDGFPSASYPGILDALALLPIDYRWSTRFICMDQHEALKSVNRYRTMWQQKVYGVMWQFFKVGKPVENRDAVEMVRDTEHVTAAVQSGEVAGGYYTATIVLMHEDYDALEESVQEVRSILLKLGFGARIESLNTMDAYLGTLPGHAIENVRSPPLLSTILADLVPTSTVWTGRDSAPCPMYPVGSPPLCYAVTHGATPFRLNLHVGDIGHTLILGPTGSGKSVLLATLAAQLRRYENMSIYAFDKGYSMFALAKAIWGTTEGADGLHFDIGKNELNFSPLQSIADPSDRAWAGEWIETILSLQDVKVTPEQRNSIALALKTLAETYKPGGPVPTLSDFVTSVQDSEIREALHQYTVDGAMGMLLDAQQDGLKTGRFTVFEIGELFQMGTKYALPVLLYLFRRIERSLTGQPAAIILDEAWLMLGDETFREKVREWLKTMRKNNALVILATQSLTDAADSGILDVIVESTATKIFLPNRFALDDENVKLYSRLGLSRRQTEIVASAIPKRQYFFTSEEGRRLYELALGPLTLSVVGVSGPESAQRIQKLIEKHSHRWFDAWLSERNLSLAKYADTTEMAA